jgi:predicted outer membrane repeat protein
VSNNAAEFDLINCTVANNHSLFVAGGALNESFSTNARMMVQNCTVSGNSAVEEGGGFQNLAENEFADGNTATLVVIDSTVSNNSSKRGGGIATGIFPLGLDPLNAILSVYNSTLSGNSANTGKGGGIFAVGDTSVPGIVTVDLGNTIINAGVSGENLITAQPVTVTSHGYNLSSDAAGGDNATGPGGLLNGVGDIRNTNPMLGSLQNNGGPTMTHALMKNSPAINAGDPNFNPYLFNPPLLYDQRGQGFPRVVGGRLDIGAFESQH